MWPDPSNAERVVLALEDFGGRGVVSTDFEEPDVVVQLGREPQQIDILTFATGRLRDRADAADLPPANCDGA